MGKDVAYKKLVPQQLLVSPKLIENPCVYWIKMVLFDQSCHRKFQIGSKDGDTL